MNDLIDLLEESLTPSEIVEMLTELFVRSKYIENQVQIEEYAVENNVCPSCYAELRLHTWKENRGEHFGFPAHETLSELRCDSCGWS